VCERGAEVVVLDLEPVEPRPVKVTSLDVSKSSRISASSRSRPTKLETCSGRFVSSSGLLNDRNGGKSPASPAMQTWKTDSGLPRSFNRCSPRSRRVTAGGKRSRTSSAVAPDTTT
jgi:hypothetical protein